MHIVVSVGLLGDSTGYLAVAIKAAAVEAHFFTYLARAV